MEAIVTRAMLAPGDEEAIRAIVAGMQAGWNVGDGAAYSAPFAEDADFVVINGAYFKGRAAIAAGHQRIFDTIYWDSVNRGTVEGVRALRDDIALVHVRWDLRFRAGTTERELCARNSLVLTKGSEGWQIAAFQNTLLVEQGPGQPMPGK